MIPAVFSIMTDYHCNFECAHCSVGSSPRTKFPMPWDLYEDVIRQIRGIPTAEVVVFTGGEATLRRDWLLDAIALAKQAGFRTRLVTNAWWAHTPEKARSFVEELKEAGLEELNTSYDDHHAPFARVEKIANMVRAGLDADLRIAVAAVVDDKSVYNAARVREEIAAGLGIEAAELAKRVFIFQDYPTPAGTGENLDIAYRSSKARAATGCSEIGKTISIHPNGLVKACCGHAMFYTPDLTIGDLHEEALAPMLERASHNLLYWWIHMYGPKRILDELGIGGEYASICHACHVLLGNPEYRARLHEFVREHRQEIFLKNVLLSDNLRAVANASRLVPKEVMEQRAESLAKRRSLPVVG